jgi:N-acylneuraminate cytidylyltransferase
MKIVSLIPARGGSKGIPKKNLYPINGKPLIEYMLDVSFNSKYIGRENTYVSTDNQAIDDFCRNKGANIIIRPDQLAKDDSTTESVMEHFSSIIYYDIIVLLQATSPLLNVKDLDDAIYEFTTRPVGFDCCFSVLPTDDILIWDFHKDKPVNYDPQNRGRRQNRASGYCIETGAFFITTRKQFMKSKCRIGKKPLYHIVSYWESFQVDTREDARMIEKLLQ